MNNSKTFLATLTALSAIALIPLILWGTTQPAFSQDQTPATSTQPPASSQGNTANKQECIKQLDLSRQQKMQLVQLKKSSEDKKAKFEQFIGMLSPAQKDELKQCMSKQ
ncbi:MAG: hypothetical protein VKL42_14710 [Snowella sp.]|nr:hypothetical protein [Snowella sp.]